MLTDEEKKRIWDEERFRSEVRQQIAEDETRKPRKLMVWAFLNSPFGIWLLATVVVGLLSWGYTEWEAARTQREAFRTLIVKLDSEIEARLQYLYAQLSQDSIKKGDFHYLVGVCLESRLSTKLRSL